MTKNPVTETEDTLSISGPSFLGLSDSNGSATGSSLSYLYEDQPVSRSHWRGLLALILVVGFAGFAVYKWRQNPSWQSEILNVVKTFQPNKTPMPQAQAAAEAQSLDNATAPAESTGNESQKPSAPESAPPDKQNSGTLQSSSPESTNSDLTDENSASSPADINDSAATLSSTKSRSANFSNSEVDNSARTEEETRLLNRAQAYLYGRGVPQSCGQALVYLRTAANKGSAKACSQLGALYATGHCVQMDRTEAYNWFTLARKADQHNIWVEKNREMLWTQMTPEERIRVGTQK